MILIMDIVTDIYGVGSDADSEENVIDVESTVVEQSIEPEPTVSFTDRQLLEAIYNQQQQIGGVLNWLVENLNGVFAMVTAVSENGGGVRGIMKMMKGMQNASDGN